jgi:hypothetical protein
MKQAVILKKEVGGCKTSEVPRSLLGKKEAILRGRICTFTFLS